MLHLYFKLLKHKGFMNYVLLENGLYQRTLLEHFHTKSLRKGLYGLSPVRILEYKGQGP